MPTTRLYFASLPVRPARSLEVSGLAIGPKAYGPFEARLIASHSRSSRAINDHDGNTSRPTGARHRSLNRRACLSMALVSRRRHSGVALHTGARFSAVLCPERG